MIDLHAHVLPGLDDGPRTLDESLAMCRLAAADGTTVVVGTPHMLDGVHNAAPDATRERAADLREALAKEGMPLRIEVGGDVHITPDLPERLARGEALTVADGGEYLLLETPSDVWLADQSQLLFELQIGGVTPILTHPERNVAVQDKPDLLLPLVEAGNLVQVTAASLQGEWGKAPRRCACELIERGLAHFVASDAHSATWRPPGLTRARAIVEGLLSPEAAEEMFLGRPTAVLRGERVRTDDPDPSPERRGLWQRLRVFVTGGSGRE